MDAATAAPAPGKKPKKTYRQDWPAYNLAQTTEKHRFQVLLHDLCRGVPSFKRKPGAGRNPVLASDAAFAAAYKVYSTLSTRRFASDLTDAFEKGYVTRPIHYNSICAYLEKPDLTMRLHTLIEHSALPLRAIETKFGPDSTGFSTSRYVRWFDEVYGAHHQKHEWVKAHIICGCNTHVVTGVEIKDRDAADGPQLPALLNATARHFTIEEVAADAAYLSRDNMGAVWDKGGVPYFAFKSNSTGGVGPFFRKMFLLYALNEKEYLCHYHQRSNVESAISMIKRKFGGHVRSRSQTAIVNEVLCKILCHNICCVIQSQCELGIEPLFWLPDGQVKE